MAGSVLAGAHAAFGTDHHLLERLQMQARLEQRAGQGAQIVVRLRHGRGQSQGLIHLRRTESARDRTVRHARLSGRPITIRMQCGIDDVGRRDDAEQVFIGVGDGQRLNAVLRYQPCGTQYRLIAMDGDRPVGGSRGGSFRAVCGSSHIRTRSQRCDCCQFGAE